MATILSFVNVPITYYSVRWWRSIHQIQSSPETVNEYMVMVFRLNLVAVLLVLIWMVAVRWRIAKAHALAELPPPLPMNPGAT